MICANRITMLYYTRYACLCVIILGKAARKKMYAFLFRAVMSRGLRQSGSRAKKCMPSCLEQS